MRCFRSRACATPFIILSLAGCAERYDDPAVAICEATLKSSIGATAENFERVSATIDGPEVLISYKISHLNTKPKPLDWSCNFGLVDNKFILYVAPSEEAEECRVRLGQILEEVKDTSANTEARSLLDDESEACNSVISKDAVVRFEKIRNIQSILAPLGIYPISREDTDLEVAEQ